MRLRPAPDEPMAGPWRVSTAQELLRLLFAAADRAAGSPVIMGIDGRSGGGKSTLAAKLHAAAPASAVIHTDDVAWHHSMFGWTELLATGVLEPIRAGRPVRYRPPGWAPHDRPGAIEVPSGLDVVIVEGVGAGRRELTQLLDASVWVQSDFAEAERRGIARDVASGVNGDREASIAFWHAWLAEEMPFLADQRPWARASVIVAGTRPVGDGPGEVVVAPMLAQPRLSTQRS